MWNSLSFVVLVLNDIFVDSMLLALYSCHVRILNKTVSLRNAAAESKFVQQNKLASNMRKGRIVIECKLFINALNFESTH